MPGRWQGRCKLTKKGDGEVRRLLYNAAMQGRRSPQWEPYYLRLRGRGMSSTAALVALGRKLARVSFALLRTDTQFVPGRSKSLASRHRIYPLKFLSATHLSRLDEQAALGKEIVIAKAGKPMSRLVPMEVSPRPKKFDLLKGRIKAPDDFNAPLEPGTLAFFKGR